MADLAAGRHGQARERSEPRPRCAAPRTRPIAGVSADIEAFHFNKAVARLYELANTIGGFEASDAATSGRCARRWRSSSA